MRNLRVLFCDDESELVSALVERLDLRDIDAVGVTSGTEALELIAASRFDVLVLDVRMPGLGGLEVISRAKLAQPDLEVILLSGHGSREDVEKGLQLNAFDYLQKPVEIDRLVQLIHDAVDSGGSEQGRG